MAVTERSDAELLGRVRDGDDSALGDLYLRHRPAALRLARSYGNAFDAEDLVNGAFERVLAALRRGHGPDEAFRPYLFVTIRRLAGDRAAAAGDDAPLDELPDAIAAADDPSVLDLTDRRLVAEAFASLPDRWQTVLWHTAIEGRRPREVARATGLPANTVSVLAHRARERLRQAYLQAHVGEGCPPACAATRARLGGHARGALARRSRSAVEAHLEGCNDCRALAAELDDVNRLLARAVAPLFVLAGGAEATLGAAGTGAATTGAAAGAAMGGAVTGEGATTAGGAAVAGGAAAAGAAGTGVGLATVAKVAATIAAVVGLVAVSPVGLPRLGHDGGRDVEVTGAAGRGPARGGDAASTTTTTAGAATVPVGPGGAGAGAAGTTLPGGVDPALDVDARVDLGGGVSVEAGVGLAPAPGVEVDAQVAAGLAEGVDLRAAWRAGVLGTGNLALEVLNPGPAPLVGGELVVDLSPGAHATSLLGGTCRATDSGVVGVVVDLLRSLTCRLTEVGAASDTSLSLPLSVVGAGQTATVRLVAGGAEVASTVVDLPA